MAGIKGWWGGPQKSGIGQTDHCIVDLLRGRAINNRGCGGEKKMYLILKFNKLFQ